MGVKHMTQAGNSASGSVGNPGAFMGNPGAAHKPRRPGSAPLPKLHCTRPSVRIRSTKYFIRVDGCAAICSRGWQRWLLHGDAVQHAREVAAAAFIA